MKSNESKLTAKPDLAAKNRTEKADKRAIKLNSEGVKDASRKEENAANAKLTDGHFSKK